jgi:hypothetical protein
MNTPKVSKLKSVGLACLLAGVAIAASANDRDKAKRIHDRIAGVPPTEAVLDQMEWLVRDHGVREFMIVDDIFNSSLPAPTS